jgi:hypothetical protein
MNETETIATVDVLVDLGFQPVADPMPGSVFDFGNFQLRATGEVWSLQFQQVVGFGGVMATPNRLAEVAFDIPQRVKSREQCIAMIVYYLDSASPKRVFYPAKQVDWVTEGRQYKHLLPWVMGNAEQQHKEFPYCLVARDWAKLALKTLADLLVDVSDETPVIFSFTDSVLTIRCNSNIIVLAGTGKTWPKKYAIPAGQLRQLPKRFMRGRVAVSIRDTFLSIGNQVYKGIKDDTP